MSALTDLSDAGLESLVTEVGGRPFQARQLAHWVYRHGAGGYEDCANLPADLRRRLAGHLPLRGTTVALAEAAADGTEKLVLALDDGETVETVIIPEGERTTLCASTQVGCPVGCVFCASGLGGVRRNLTRGEIVEQVLHARDRLPEGRRLTNLVVMGMGEPLLNLDELLPALDRIRDPAGIGLGARRITVSTSGYPRQMARFAAADPAYNLAVSLHAAEKELRRRLVPHAPAAPREIVEAARTFFARKGRQVTFEVVLLAGINDRQRDAEAMISLLRGFPCTVNLIPWNPVEAIPDLQRPKAGAVETFAGHLRRGGLNVTVRRQRGADKSAACGQLRIRTLAT